MDIHKYPDHDTVGSKPAQGHQRKIVKGILGWNELDFANTLPVLVRISYPGFEPEVWPPVQWIFHLPFFSF